MYAEVVVNAPVKKTFHYHIPPELSGEIRPGHLVQVAFGTALQHGIVVGLNDSSDIEQTKPIEARLDPRPVVTAQQIDLAFWMSARYLAPPAACLWLMLPPGLTGGRDILVTLLDESYETDDPVAAPLIALLKRRGPLRGKQLATAKALHGSDWRATVEALAKAGVVEAVRILAPSGVRPKTIKTAALAIRPQQIPNVARHLGKRSRRADLLEVIAALPEGQAPLNQALKTAGVSRGTLDALVKLGLVETVSSNPPMVALALPEEAVEENLIELRGGYKHLHILETLADAPQPMEIKQLYAQSGANMADLKRLQEAGLITLGEAQIWRDSLAERDFVPSIAPPLTPEQAAAWEIVEETIKRWDWESREEGSNGSTFLLHGVTGSGKTEIYLRAIELTLAQGRQAIFLVPEIALTPQTVQRVLARFPGQVAVVHSGLSAGERYDAWRRAREGLIQVAVGARSALFTPFPDVGLIVLDEEHDHSYKQSPPIGQPYYDARAVAHEMARANEGVLILGSATPSLESAYSAQNGAAHLLQLPNRIMGHRTRILEQAERQGVAARYYPANAEEAVMIDLPTVQVIDMRAELKADNRSIFSRALQTGLAEVLERGEQAILFLNRRGTATYVFCRDCGYVVSCPRCEMPMTYHRHGEDMRCHHCGLHQPEPQACPQCGSKRIKHFGAGTQQVEQALREFFPGVRALRWDADTARSSRAHDDLLRRFIDGDADVLVGTQMIAKGLDLPLVTLVGVVSADTGIALPDFRAGERTFQLLTQVAGRAGRGLLGGHVVLQTYQPEHYAVAAASGHDYEQFYTQEIEYRRELGLPPFRRLVRLLFRFDNEAKAEDEAARAAKLLQRRLEEQQLTGTELVGPAPCFFRRLDGVYRWHLLLRGPDPTAALQDLDIPRGWHVDIDPVDVL